MIRNVDFLITFETPFRGLERPIPSETHSILRKGAWRLSGSLCSYIGTTPGNTDSLESINAVLNSVLLALAVVDFIGYLPVSLPVVFALLKGECIQNSCQRKANAKNSQ